MRSELQATVYALVFIFLCASGTATASSADSIKIQDPWIREAPPGSTALAGYVRISNRGNKKIYLENASSDAFGMAMIHKSMMNKDRQMTMMHMDKVEIPAGETVSLEPGGLHIMLMRPDKQYKAGDRVDISLQFSDGMSKKTSFVVKRK